MKLIIIYILFTIIMAWLTAKSIVYAKDDIKQVNKELSNLKNEIFNVFKPVIKKIIDLFNQN